MRARRLVSTPSVAATPVSRNTGATADWIRRAISMDCDAPKPNRPAPAEAGNAATGAASGGYCGRGSCCCTIVQQRTRRAAYSHETQPPAVSRTRRARRQRRPESTRLDLPRCGILRARAAGDLPQQLAAGVPPERRAAPGGLPSLRVLRRIGAGAARRGRRGAGISQWLPAPRGAPARRAARPLRGPHHLPVPRLDLCPGRTPGRCAAARQLPRARSGAARARAARARAVHGLRLRALRARVAERARDGGAVRARARALPPGGAGAARAGHAAPAGGELEERRGQLFRRPAHQRGAPGAAAPVRPGLRHRGAPLDRQDVGHAARYAFGQLVRAALSAAAAGAAASAARTAAAVDLLQALAEPRLRHLPRPDRLHAVPAGIAHRDPDSRDRLCAPGRAPRDARRALVGGAAVTEEFHPGSRTSVAAYTVSLLNPKVIRDLDLAGHGLRIVERRCANFLPTADGGYLLTGEGRTQAEVARFSARDAARLPEYAERLEGVADVPPELALTPPPNVPEGTWRPALPELVRAARVGGRLRRLDMSSRRELLALFAMSAGDYLDNWFESDPLKAVYGFDGIVGNYASPYTPGSAYVLLHHVFGEVNGKRGAWGHAIGGMGAITQAMARAATARGALIRVSSAVREGLVQGDRAVGVLTESGEGLRAAAVISNLQPKMLYLQMFAPEALPSEFREP